MRQELRSVRRLVWPGHHASQVPEPPADMPASRTLWVPGRGEMFFRQQEGPVGALPVLLLHGWTASADTTWFAVYPALAGSHPLVAVDQRGHGRGIRSEDPFTLEACADDAAALLKTLGIPRAIVAGYSLGGAVALLMWQRHRSQVAGLVLASTALEWRTTAHERLIWQSLGLFEVALRLGTGDGLVQRYLEYAVSHTPEVDQLRAWVSGEFKRGHARDIAEAGRALGRFDARGYVGQIDVACASVVTERDRLVRAKEQRTLADALHAPMFPLDFDHDAPLVQPKEFTAAITDAVDSVARRSGGAG